MALGTHFINGAPLAGEGQQRSPVYNPALGEVIYEVPLATEAEVNRAVAAAKAAFPAWAALPMIRRARYMFRLYELLNQHVDEIAAAVTREHGKTLDDARGEVQRGIEIVEYACGMPQVLEGRYSAQVASGVDQFSLRQPLGVSVGITPFNFPIMIPLWMAPLAITAGNSFILKPSERDPAASLMLAELAIEAGIPPGVLNVLQGDKTAVSGLLTHPDVRAVSFVGSSAVAQQIYATGAAAGKRVQALGGAKNHLIVMPDADIEAAATALMGAGYGAAGERCMAVSVAVPVGEATAEALREALIPRLAALKIGPGDQAQVDMGPLISQAAHDRIRGLINSGVQAGAELVVDGRDYKPQGYEEGFFMGGSLFDHVRPEMEIYTQEIFGPVLSQVRAASFEEAVSLASRHAYGNGAALYTRDGGLARRFVQEAEVGMLGVNVPIPVPSAWHSFGGWKASLFGDTPMYGQDGARFWTRPKNVMTRWHEGERGAAAAFNFARSAG